ncbi:MAG: MBOAT family protein [Clostridiaceae bacterium]|jgi:alginate O-acetyltransferase complex protein AlgI|nr:MBOAT family protein [Clostridiaceae bacterium]
MVFSSLFFLYVFLPLCLILVWSTEKTKTQNIILLVFSLFFYAWGEPIYVILLVFTTLFIWGCGMLMGRARRRSERRTALTLAIVVSIGSLVVFKYTGFIVEIINLIPFINIPIPKISLPIGISFYTFQALSYIIDLYRGQIKIQRTYYKFLLYVSLFPQLIAGPIVRYIDVEKEIAHREITLEGIVSGIGRFVVGLCKKVLIANHAGEIVDFCLESDHFAQISSATAILGILAFTFQLYFDFSGYSDMAIGLGRMFGFKFLENFNYPYISRSVTEFWRRWHISLSTFFRDYLYIPLGGNRRHPIRNTFIVWFLTGLWHGAHFNFVLWGLYYFVILLIERWLILPLHDKTPKWIWLVPTFISSVFGWSIFYFTDFSRLFTFYGRIFAPGLAGFADMEARILWRQHLIFLIVAFIASTPILPWVKERFYGYRRVLERSRTIGVLRTAFTLLLLFACTASLVASSYNPFLYFRF